eukprot:m51a1_g11524 hypothetical protein (96) ;mRNA; f:6842-7129
MEPRWSDYPTAQDVFQVTWSSLLAGEWSSTLYLDCVAHLLHKKTTVPEHFCDYVMVLYKQLMLFLRHVTRALLVVARETLGHDSLQHAIAEATAV